MKTYTSADANPAALRDKLTVIYGYGSQGRAHARNLHESGFNVLIAARPEGASFKQAQADGLAVDTPENAIPKADLIALLLPLSRERCHHDAQGAPTAMDHMRLLHVHQTGRAFVEVAFNFHDPPSEPTAVACAAC